MLGFQSVVRVLLSAVVFCLILTPSGWSQTFHWLGTLEPFTSSAAFGVSSDGIAVGASSQAFRWTSSLGMQSLGTLGGTTSHAWGISADGSVIVGSAQIASGQNRAFRWTQATGMQELGVLVPNSSIHAHAASADGAVVVGYALNASAQRRAFRWTQATGLQELGTLGGTESWAYGVSADGSVIVGTAQTRAFGPFEAFRWEGGVMQALGTLGGINSSAYAVSADGSVAVGLAETADGSGRAFRWTQALGMQDLGALAGFNQSNSFRCFRGRLCRGGQFGRSRFPMDTSRRYGRPERDLRGLVQWAASICLCRVRRRTLHRGTRLQLGHLPHRRLPDRYTGSANPRAKHTGTNR
jgi:probable HAF family extracellular repeat protein